MSYQYLFVLLLTILLFGCTDNVCDIDNLGACDSQSCTSAGFYWCDADGVYSCQINQCLNQEAPSGNQSAPPLPDVDAIKSLINQYS